MLLLLFYAKLAVFFPAAAVECSKVKYRENLQHFVGLTDNETSSRAATCLSNIRGYAQLFALLSANQRLMHGPWLMPLHVQADLQIAMSRDR